jgi:hypothetical protein
MADSGIAVTMQGYRSQLADDEEWPDTYVVVRTDPDVWATTVELRDLVALAEGRLDVAHRQLRPHTNGQLVGMVFGSTAVLGSPEEWLRLAARVRDNAESAAGLVESPHMRPFDEVDHVLEVGDVRVVERHWERWLPEVALSVDEERLADAGGFTDEEWVAQFGTGWESSVGESPLAYWPEVFVWGTPAQLAAQLTEDGRLEVGMAGGYWDLPGVFVPAVQEAQSISASMSRPVLEAVLRDLLVRRRASFTWCRSCGTQLAPEQRHDETLCFGCATTLLGVVH